MRNFLTRAWDIVRAVVASHPVKVRMAVAAILVYLGQFVPAVADFVGSDGVVDFVTGAVLALLAGDAVRASRKN